MLFIEIPKESEDLTKLTALSVPKRSSGQKKNACRQPSLLHCPSNRIEPSSDGDGGDAPRLGDADAESGNPSLMCERYRPLHRIPNASNVLSSK